MPEKRKDKKKFVATKQQILGGAREKSLPRFAVPFSSVGLWCGASLTWNSEVSSLTMTDERKCVVRFESQSDWI